MIAREGDDIFIYAVAQITRMPAGHYLIDSIASRGDVDKRSGRKVCVREKEREKEK